MEGLSIILSVNSFIITMIILSYYLNNSSNQGIYFGVRIPQKYQGENEIKRLEKNYKKNVIYLFSILTVIINLIIIFNLKSSEFVISMIMIISVVSMLLAHSILFVIYYKKVKLLKEINNWNYKTNNVVVIDTTLRKPKKNEKYKALNEKIFLIPIIIPISTLILTVSRKEYFVSEDLYKIYKTPIYGIILCIIMFILTKITLSSKVDLNSGSIQTAVKRKKKFKRVISIFLFIAEIETILLYSVIQIGVVYNFNSMPIENLINIVILVSMLIFILIFIIIGQGGRNIKEDTENDDLYKNDDDKWILGMFYYNKNDPAFMVEKRVGIGSTINFANKKAVIIFILLIALIIIFSIRDLKFSS